jgi:hypothetical protein
MRKHSVVVIAASVSIVISGCGSNTEAGPGSSAGASGAGSGSGRTGTSATGSSSGVSGTTGGSGSSGGTGNSGSTGSSGSSGSSGTSGPSGTSGAGGQSGSNDAGGSPDASGTSGSATKDGGSGTSGASGSSGSSGSSGAATDAGSGLSAGCGTTPTIASSSYNNGDPISITAASMQRRYILSVPTNYDNTKPYKLVVAFHARDSNDHSVYNEHYYDLEPSSNNTTIFVAPNGQQNGAPCTGTGAGDSGCGWPNPNDSDLALADAVVAQIEQSFCVDTNHIFATGWSYGASMSEYTACKRPLGGSSPARAGHRSTAARRRRPRRPRAATSARTSPAARPATQWNSAPSSGPIRLIRITAIQTAVGDRPKSGNSSASSERSTPPRHSG